MDSRASITDIAAKLGKPLTTVFDAERQLRSEKLAQRYCAMLNFEKLGISLRTVFVLKRSRAIEHFLLGSPFLNNLQLLKNGMLLAEAAFRDMRQLTRLEERISPSVIASYPIVEELKIEGARLK